MVSHPRPPSGREQCYLAAFSDPTLLYVANALLHPLLGIIAGVFLVALIVRRRYLLAGAGENWQTVHSGSSYCSQSKLTLTFGLGQEAEAQAVEIPWPSGQHDALKNLKANNTYAIQEGGKVLSTRPFKR